MSVRPGGGWKRKPTRLFSGPCPVTGGRPTTMLRRTFVKMCILQQEDFDSSCRFICKGRWPQVGLELIEDVKNFASEEDNTMAVPSAIQAGTCGLCGAKKKVRKVREKTCCATCEHIWRAAHVSSGLLVDALNQARGEEYLRDKVGTAVPVDYDDMKRRLHAMEKTYENMRLALGCQGDEAALESVIRLVKERDGALDDLQQIRADLGASLDDDLEGVAKLRMGTLAMLDKENIDLNQEVTRLRQLLADAEAIVDGDRLSVSLVAEESVTSDAALLDLALDVLAGKITGIDAARISALR